MVHIISSVFPPGITPVEQLKCYAFHILDVLITHKYKISIPLRVNTIYSRTSMARTLVARLPRLFRTSS